MSTLSVGILTAAVSGDQRAVGVVLADIRPTVLSFCRGRIPRRGDLDVQDIAQEVLISVARMLPTFEVRSVPEFISAIQAIVHCRIVDMWRVLERQVPISRDEIPDWGGPVTLLSPDRVMLARLDFNEMAALAMRELTRHQRRILLMRAEGRMNSEIGDVLGRTANSVRVLHFRAIERLRAAAERSEVS